MNKTYRNKKKSKINLLNNSKTKIRFKNNYRMLRNKNKILK